MKPIPVAFHLGPLQLHTYGFGLAVTFFFAYWYFERRLRARGYPTAWVARTVLWIVVAALVGARAVHVLANLPRYEHQPAQVLAVWNGGLSSFGGLLGGVPVGIALARRRCPALGLGRALDLAAPVMAASWALGRLLGPQLMTGGGGHRTHQWFGMAYAGQSGRRVPVPVFQALEDALVWAVLIVLERALARRAGGRGSDGADEAPTGTVLGVAMVLWGVERAVDEKLWLAQPGQLGDVLVEVAGLVLVAGGIALLVLSRRRWRRWVAPAPLGAGPQAQADAATGTAPTLGGTSTEAPGAALGTGPAPPGLHPAG